MSSAEHDVLTLLRKLGQRDKMQKKHVHILALCVSLLLSLVKRSAETSQIPGHRRPFGAHMMPMGVTVIGRFSSPHVFYGHFVKANKPIHMKSALTEADHPGLGWTDEFLRNHYGTEMVRVEVGKTEVRSRKAQWMRLSNFIDDYPHSDLYMVHSITGSMKDMVQIPTTLQCGGFQHGLLEAVLWMGKGPLHSVLHYDELDNLLCVFDGTKDVILIDQFYKDKVEAHGFDQKGHYSTVNMKAVDMHSFPEFQNLPWYRVHLAAGDCIYIPNGWYHQVTTYGDRSLAMNIWFSHLWWFDDEECSNFQAFSKFEPLEVYGFASPNEAVRSRWLEAFEGTDDDVDLKDFLKRVSSGTEEHRKKVFPLIDRDEDGLLSWEELYGFNINKVLPLYPDVFHPSAVSEQENTKETGGGDTDSKLCSSEETEFNRGVCKNQMKEKTAEEKELDESGKSEHRLFDHEEL